MKYIITFTLLLGSFVASAEELPEFLNKSPGEGLMEALEYYDIHHKDIVYAQAILETGYFKSHGCVKYNNVFGIKKGNRLKRYKHWYESVIDYKYLIQDRYREGENYYRFLRRIRYATNPKYTKTLKKIVNGRTK